MQNQPPTRSNAADVDVALPLQPAATVDVDLPLATDTASLRRKLPMAQGVQPTMSQVAASVSVHRVRWPNRSRSGYHGGSAWNWMRDGHVGFGARSDGGP